MKIRIASEGLTPPQKLEFDLLEIQRLNLYINEKKYLCNLCCQLYNNTDFYSNNTSIFEKIVVK